MSDNTTQAIHGNQTQLLEAFKRAHSSWRPYPRQTLAFSGANYGIWGSYLMRSYAGGHKTISRRFTTAGVPTMVAGKE